MDAKVLRAAVSAAIRVTVSTTLIGCGGTVATDGGKAQGPAANGPAKLSDPVTSSTGSTTSGTSGSNGWGWTPPHEGQSGSSSSGGSVVAQGGLASVGGEAAGGSAEGGSAEGGDGSGTPVVTPPNTCDALNTCLTHLEVSMPAAPLAGNDLACCQVMIDSLKEHQLAPGADACWADLNGRLMSSVARSLCCNSPETWQVSACTPWGPPVPPELPEDALSAWEAAA